jgi:hypothetical protein
MLTGYYAVSPSDVKLVSDSLKERLILNSEDQKTQVHEAKERMKGLLCFVFSPKFLQNKIDWNEKHGNRINLACRLLITSLRSKVVTLSDWDKIVKNLI